MRPAASEGDADQHIGTKKNNHSFAGWRRKQKKTGFYYRLSGGIIAAVVR